MSITFKKNPPPKGLASIGYRKSTQIKLYKKNIGSISEPPLHSSSTLWTIILAVKKTQHDIAHPENNPNCAWKWYKPQLGFKEEQQARQWIKENYVAISEEYEYHLFED